MKAFRNFYTIGTRAAPPVPNPPMRIKLIIAMAALCVGLLSGGCAGSAGRRHTAAPPPESPSAKVATDAGAADSGALAFDAHCAACHLSGGPGNMGEAPRLDGSSWVAGPEEVLIKIVLHGLHGTIRVGDKTYNQEMPAFGKVLSDDQIALLVSYVRARFGGLSAPVSPAMVQRVRDATHGRTSYWTADELLRNRQVPRD